MNETAEPDAEPTAGPHATQRIDTATPHPARMYDYYIGGKDNYEVDRSAAERILAGFPQLRTVALANRAFLQRAVRYLATLGIDQFLDIGTGIPGNGDAAETARAINPKALFVAVDNNPIVIAHARARLGCQNPGATQVLQADVRNPEALLWHAGLDAVLDLGEPVALLMVSVLHYLTDAEHPELVVRRLVDALVPGSYLVVSHATAEGDTEQALAAAYEYQHTSAPITLRAPQQIARFFDGLDLLEPGVVPQPWWRPDSQVTANPHANWCYGGVAQKP